MKFKDLLARFLEADHEEVIPPMEFPITIHGKVYDWFVIDPARAGQAKGLLNAIEWMKHSIDRLERKRERLVNETAHDVEDGRR